MKLREMRAPLGWKLLKVVMVYILLGIAFRVMDVLYCHYRAAAGNPSDLPCFYWPWEPIELATWPLAALNLVVVGYAVLVPPTLVRSIGAVFLGVFTAALVWVSRDRPRRVP